MNKIFNTICAILAMLAVCIILLASLKTLGFPIGDNKPTLFLYVLMNIGVGQVLCYILFKEK